MFHFVTDISTSSHWHQTCWEDNPWAWVWTVNNGFISFLPFDTGALLCVPLSVGVIDSFSCNNRYNSPLKTQIYCEISLKYLLLVRCTKYRVYFDLCTVHRHLLAIMFMICSQRKIFKGLRNQTCKSFSLNETLNTIKMPLVTL